MSISLSSALYIQADYLLTDQPNVLNLLYAQLELDFGYIRAVTPCYAVYDITQRSAEGWKAVLEDPAPAAQVVRAQWKSRGSAYQVC